MATTLKNFVSLTAAAGSGYGANGVALAVDAGTASSQSAAGLATLLDRWTSDLSKAGYSKNGCVVLTLSGTTPVTIDLTSLNSQTVYAGDTSFATWKEVIFTNLGATDLTVSPGASNPLRTPLGGTSPTLLSYASGKTRWHCPAGQAVDGTHKTLTITPTSGGTIAICVGGA